MPSSAAMRCPHGACNREASASCVAAAEWASVAALAFPSSSVMRRRNVAASSCACVNCACKADAALAAAAAAASLDAFKSANCLRSCRGRGKTHTEKEEEVRMERRVRQGSVSRSLDRAWCAGPGWGLTKARGINRARRTWDTADSVASFSSVMFLSRRVSAAISSVSFFACTTPILRTNIR